ncbi:MAG: hypothetical protein LBN27_09975 [Prevotellaceae bacterium]|jgi:hypothetical protein|nr:hypothetical protein [Prevotellaceae bacterium]
MKNFILELADEAIKGVETIVTNTNVLSMVTEKVGDFVKEKVPEAMEAVGDFITENVSDAIENVGDFL